MIKILIFTILLAQSSISQADCVSLVKGYIALDVNTCGVLRPEMSFNTSLERYQFIKGLPPNEQKKFWNSYRGMIIRGLVAKSQAVKSGLTKEVGALNGESISAFVHPGSSALSCSKLSGKRIKAFLDEACCEGGGDPPCLLNSAYTLKNIKVIGSQQAPATKKQKAIKKSKLYIAAIKAFREKQFKKAIHYFENARSQTGIDIMGLYLLALSLREEDRCGQALNPLQAIEKRAEKNDYWASEETFIRKSRFLLARCYSKINKPGFAVTVLQGYLSNPAKYANELRASLRHKDFGWIHTSKEYQKYKSEVERVLQK